MFFILNFAFNIIKISSPAQICSRFLTKYLSNITGIFYFILILSKYSAVYYLIEFEAKFKAHLKRKFEIL